MDKQKYLCKFDKKGYRRETYLTREYTDEKKAEMIANGYVEITEDEWNYYVGNKGEGDNGTGYIRDPQTGKPISAPPHMPAKAEKLAQLEAEYQQEKAQLEGYFTTALLMNDTDTQTELKSEMTELEEWYKNEKIGRQTLAEG